MNRPVDVLAAGELFIDMILSGFARLPRTGEEAVAREFHRDIGGGAAITAAGLAKLGSSAGVLGVVGREDGDWVIERFRLAGINTSAIFCDPDQPTAFTVAVSDATDRTFFTYAGANRLFPEKLKQFAANPENIGARHIHLAFAPTLETAPELIQALRRSGCSLSLDVGWHEAWLADERALTLVAQLDVFFPNEREAARMTGEQEPHRILQRFEAAGARAVALKLGPRGAALLWQGQMYFRDPLPVTPVDTTGAGDCFDAGFLHAMLKGRDPAACLRIANICGALSTEAPGGILGFPTSERLHAALKGGL